MSPLAFEQQVNLFQPILRAEQRLFSAQAVAAALLVLVVCLAGLAGYGSWRTGRIERSLEQLSRREAANIAVAARASAVVRPAATLEQLDAEAMALSADIVARQRTLDIARQGVASPTTGFAARLAALAQQQINGVWLSYIILGSGEGLLAMRGGATDSRLVVGYLAALQNEAALSGVRFDRLVMRHAVPSEAPAEVVFDLDTAGLRLPNRDRAK